MFWYLTPGLTEFRNLGEQREYPEGNYASFCVKRIRYLLENDIYNSTRDDGKPRVIPVLTNL